VFTPTAAVVADINGDGHADIAVSGYEGVALVLLGDGTGKLASPKQSAFLGSSVNDMTVADFNNDGKLDLAAPVGGAVIAVSVLLGNGDGTFEAPKKFPFQGAHQIAAGDHNGDGNVDIVTGALGSGNIEDNITVLFGNGDGTFRQPIVHDIGFGGVTAVNVSDLDKDGLGDITVDGYWGDDVHIFFGDGHYAYYVNDNSCCTGHSVADMDHDSDLDLVFGSSAGVGVMLNDGNGTLAPAIETPGSYTLHLNLADYDRDGNVDVTVSVSADYVGVFLGNGDGTLQSSQYFTALGLGKIATGDLNHDRYPDLVRVHTGSKALYVLLNDRNWSSPIPPPPATRNIGIFRTAGPLTMRALPKTDPASPHHSDQDDETPHSFAIDAGHLDPADPPDWDQRGPSFPRIVNGTVDIGAVEVQAITVPGAGMDLAMLSVSGV
jgi:hypothetical protein